MDTKQTVAGKDLDHGLFGAPSKIDYAGGVHACCLQSWHMLYKYLLDLRDNDRYQMICWSATLPSCAVASE